LLTLVLITSPIGAGAMNNLWSAVAPDRHAGPQMVALVTGVLNGIVCALGCLLGGWVADRFGRWWSYFGFGVALAFAAIIMAFAPWTRTAYAIGRGVASTKYAICQSLGNIPVAYMTAFNGWVHDRYGGVWMLNGEALLALVCIAAGLIVLQRINASRVSVSSSIAVLP